MENNKTAMMRLYDMLDEGKISDIAEIKEYFLMLEQKQIEAINKKYDQLIDLLDNIHTALARSSLPMEEYQDLSSKLIKVKEIIREMSKN